MKNKWTRFLLALLLCAGLLAVCAHAEGGEAPQVVDSGACGDGVTWTLDENGLLTIRGTGAMGESSFHTDHAEDVLLAVIEPGVTSIAANAFEGCSRLGSISIPDSVASIGNEAFSRCTGLKRISIPGGVASIGSYAFAHCRSLQRASIASGVTSIGPFAFSRCYKLTDVAIPDSVTSLGSGAFRNCESLERIAIPDSVTSLGSQAFQECTSLVEISIPQGVTTIGAYAFDGCARLATVVLQEGLREIGEYAFRKCEALTRLTVPESVTRIGIYALANSGLEELAMLNPDANSPIIGSYACLGTTPTVYCYPDSRAAAWAQENFLDSPVLIDAETGIDSLRTLTLPEDFRIARGQARRLLPNVLPDDGTPALWTSSNETVATVDEKGVLTAVAPGTATITATVGSASDSLDVEVFIAAESFALNLEEAWVHMYTDVQLSPTDIRPEGAELHILWRSAETAYAAVNDEGLVHTNGAGDVVVSADDGDIHRECLLHIYSDVTAVAFADEPPTMGIGTTRQLTANVTARTRSCVNHLVAFTSDDEAVATVRENGVVTARAVGTATIEAKAENGRSASILVTVVDCAATGHNWGEPVYTWSEDNASVTASRACIYDPKHVETETVSATGEVTTPATCEELGVTTYTSAAFGNAAFEVQVKAVEDVPATGHAWDEPSYTWSEDNASVTASRTCIHDPKHAETETAQAALRLVTAPTETEMGTTGYTASFKSPAFPAQEKTARDIPALKDLSLLELPSDLEAIGADAFLGTDCEGVIIPDGCASIGAMAFADCKELVYVRIPASVTDIAADAFAGSARVRIDRAEPEAEPEP